MGQVVSPVRRVFAGSLMLGVIVFVSTGMQAVRNDPPFPHKPHESVACLTCHEYEDGSGRLFYKVISNCDGCHHSQENRARCASCHTGNELRRVVRQTVPWKLSVWASARERDMTFTHAEHRSVACQTCHSSATSLRSQLACTSCHADHHDELRVCTSCHSAVKRIPEHTADVHRDCATSGCHSDPVTRPLRVQRNVCLGCHTDQADHEPQGDCATCHRIPGAQEEDS